MRDPTHRDLPPVRYQIGELSIRVADPAMRALFIRARRLAAARLPVLIYGESGAGKEIVASALHHLSTRAGALVPINCGAIAASLIETELFGHEKGAFSGAAGARDGLLASAAGGTVLLDEIGELPGELQTRLLRFLDNHEVTRVGAVTARSIDVRVVAATNRDLLAEVGGGRFRADLYHRLKGTTLHIPALRDRPLDVPLLAQDLLDAACRDRERPPLPISAAAMGVLVRCPWPGNVRELKHAMDLLAVTVDDSEIGLEHLEDDLRVAAAPGLPPRRLARGTLPPPLGFRSLGEEMFELEGRRIAEALAATDGVQTKAAALLGIPRRTFLTKMKLHGLGRRGQCATSAQVRSIGPCAAPTRPTPER